MLGSLHQSVHSFHTYSTHGYTSSLLKPSFEPPIHYDDIKFKTCLNSELSKKKEGDSICSVLFTFTCGNEGILI